MPQVWAAVPLTRAVSVASVLPFTPCVAGVGVSVGVGVLGVPALLEDMAPEVDGWPSWLAWGPLLTPGSEG